MLVIISDIHLTDGSSGETVHQGTFRIFRERLRGLAYAASWRDDGKYRPIERLDIILLGDILDVLRSSKWLENRPGALSAVRPWDDPQSPAFVGKVRAITEAILENNRVFFSMMRELRDGIVASIPPASGEGRPLRVGRGSRPSWRAPVPVHLHYMVGNHDWFFHLPFPAYDEIRSSIVQKLGLDNDPNAPFPHDPAEPGSAEVRRAMEDHRVFARHGDIYDPVNFAERRDRASLGDAIVVDLVTRFAVELKARLGDALPPSCLLGMNEIDSVRPLLMVPVWVGGLLRRTCPDPRLQRRVSEIWNGLIRRFMQIPFVREQFESFRHPVEVQKLKWALRISENLLSPQGSRLVCWMGRNIGQQRKSYAAHALQEAQFRNRTSRFIVYGHTHRHEMVPLDAFYEEDLPSTQIYVNSGTWRPTHELARFRPSRESFVGYHNMTYLSFFKDGERGGRTFECWSGNLASSKTRGPRLAS
ncbi:MAG TPA: hypothetical protein VJX67_21755 [Blastocatellia bacterium]|nr:hypothetical protein [Blastocatellia bacterium]